MLIPLGFIVAPKSARKLFPPLLVIFIIANLFRFSPDMINNHKFFNFFLILGSGYSAFFLTKLPKLVSIPIVFLLIFGGVVDLFPVVNDRYIAISDINPDITFFRSTSPSSIILNSTWFFHPASLAGRKIFNGYSYFVWSYGYDQASRERETVNIYSAPDQKTVCHQLKINNIDYVELSRAPEGFINPNLKIWNSLSPEYINPSSGLRIYNVSHICPKN